MFLERFWSGIRIINMTITINVTDEDILRGRRKDPIACPIALAARRAGLSDPWVHRLTMTFFRQSEPGCTEIRTDLPPETSGFILDFDRGCRVDPFQFTITVPE